MNEGERRVLKKNAVPSCNLPSLKSEYRLQRDAARLSRYNNRCKKKLVDKACPIKALNSNQKIPEKCQNSNCDPVVIDADNGNNVIPNNSEFIKVKSCDSNGTLKQVNSLKESVIGDEKIINYQKKYYVSQPKENTFFHGGGKNSRSHHLQGWDPD